MTYNPDYERSRLPNDGLGEYPNQYNEKGMSGKVLFIILAAIFIFFGSLAFFAGDTTVTIDEGNLSKPLETATPKPVLTSPVVE